MQRRDPRIYPAALLLLALLWAVAGWALVDARRQARLALTRLQQRQQEWVKLAGSVAAPDGPIESVLDDALQQHDRRLQELRDGLTGAAALRGAAAAPVDSTGAYFALAAFVEENKDLARAAGVTLARGESFGFAEYSRAGPATEQLGRFHREWILVADVLTALWEARPAALLSVRRVAAVGGTAQVQSPAVPGDSLPAPDAGRSPQPGAEDKVAVRIEFAGNSASLRLFLARLAQHQRLLLVTDVGIEPMGAPPIPPSGMSQAVVQPGSGLTRFAVVVERPLGPVAGVPAS